MTINGVIFTTELSDIIGELRNQLELNGIPLLSKVQNTPDNIMVCCPYHKNGQETRPSAGIRKSDGQFHCLACGETHSLQEMISHCFGHYDDMIGAFGWQWLLKNFLTISVEERDDIELDLSRAKSTNKTVYVSEEELDLYRYYHPYMYKRKLTNEIIDIFDIGYDKKTECITFPVRDIYGRTLFVARRSVNTKYFNYPSGAEKPVYGLYELYTRSNELVTLGCNEFAEATKYKKGYPNEVIICESMLDALTCWVYGRYAVALNGLGTTQQLEQLNRMPCRKFILATDMDKAGLGCRTKLKKGLKGKIATEYIWDLDIAKDINDMSKEYFDNLEEKW